MLVAVAVHASFAFNGVVQIQFANRLELSLDCAICQKKWRTVVLSSTDRESFCTPTHHPFPARIVDQKVFTDRGVTEVVYTVEYEFFPFEDSREKWRHDPIAHAMPSWGRVHFDLTCPRCGRVSKRSTQTNIVRPWTAYCECDWPLYTETHELPLFERLEAPS
jgi:hypothetical protein